MPIGVKGDTLIQILKEPSTIAIILKKTIIYQLHRPQLPYAEQTRTWCHPHCTKIDSLFAFDWPENDNALYGDYLCYVFLITILSNSLTKIDN